MKPVEFVITETDETLVTHSGLALARAHGDRPARRRTDAAGEAPPRREARGRAAVLLFLSVTQHAGGNQQGTDHQRR
jgi:hypothetical protein